MKVYLSTLEMAERLCVSQQQVARLAKLGRIPSVRCGRCIKIPVAAYEKWLADQTTEALASMKKVETHAGEA